MSRSKLDSTHIIQRIFDEATESAKVKIENLEMAIELDANDGDSVTTHPVKLTASAIGCDADDNNTDIIPSQDCSSLREIRVDVDGSGIASVMVSPNDSGDFFYIVGPSGQTHYVCARRVKVKSLDVVGDVHLVGRS